MSTNVCHLLVFVCVNKFYVFFIARGQMRKIGIHFIIYPCIEHRISFLLRTNRPMSRIDSCARSAIKFCFYICACATVFLYLRMRNGSCRIGEVVQLLSLGPSYQ